MEDFAMKRMLRNALKVWNQFCEFTSIAGFRFMSTKVTFSIRSTAMVIFVLSVAGLVAQLIYLVNQYLENHILISSRQEPLDIIPLPLVYICNSLADTNKINFIDVCRRRQKSNETIAVRSTQEDRFAEELSRRISSRYFSYCNFDVFYHDYSCEFRCKWTSNGFCLEARRGSLTQFVPDSLISFNSAIVNETTTSNHSKSSNLPTLKYMDVKAARIFDIQIYFNIESPYTTVYLRSYADPLTDRNEYVPLVGAPHIVMDINALNAIQITEILNVSLDLTHKEPNSLINQTRTVSFEFCVWKEYSDLLIQVNETQCDRQLYTKRAMSFKCLAK